MFALDPEKAVSVVRFRPRFYETDLMGIVHHANYLKYYELGRVEWLRRRGSTFADWQARGHNFPVVDAQVSYKKPCRFDDDLALRLELVLLQFEPLAEVDLHADLRRRAPDHRRDTARLHRQPSEIATLRRGDDRDAHERRGPGTRARPLEAGSLPAEQKPEDTHRFKAENRSDDHQAPLRGAFLLPGRRDQRGQRCRTWR